MLVTDLAYRDMEARADGLMGRIAHLFSKVFRRSAPVTGNPEPAHQGSEFPAHLRLVSTGDVTQPDQDNRSPMVSGDYRWRRHPQLLKREVSHFTHDADDVERGARSAAVRGLFLARSGRIEDARAAFAVAAAEDTIDITAVPGFWDLSRGGMMAAVGAYEDADRFRDAAALGARIRLKYRPRSVSALPEVPARRTTASGS